MKYLKLFEKFIQDSDFELTIEKDSILFHATGEDFEPEGLHGGFFDKILWTAEDSGIAQMYIPTSGAVMYCSAESIARPNKDSSIQQIQKKLGIEYDYSTVEWNRDRAESYKNAPIWEDPSEEQNWSKTNEFKRTYIKTKMKEVLGYEPWNEDHGDLSFAVYFNLDELMPADYKMKGRLFIITVEADLKIYDMTMGKKIEGDLGDLDYYKIGEFEKLEKKGFDGVRINDFAQSDREGNLGHTSIGLFTKGVKKCTWEILPNVVHPDDTERMFANRDWSSQEYLAYKDHVKIKK